MLWEFTKQLKAPGSTKMLANEEQRKKQNKVLDIYCIVYNWPFAIIDNYTIIKYLELYSLLDIISERT